MLLKRPGVKKETPFSLEQAKVGQYCYSIFKIPPPQRRGGPAVPA